MQQLNPPIILPSPKFSGKYWKWANSVKVSPSEIKKYSKSKRRTWKGVDFH